MPWVHRMSDINRVEKTAVCAECGPTSIRVRNNKARTAECMTMRRRYRDRRHGPRTDMERRDAAEAQGHRCALCLRSTELVDDHDHATGNARAMLCSKCNTVLGLVGEDENLLQRMAEYLCHYRKLKNPPPATQIGEPKGDVISPTKRI